MEEETSWLEHGLVWEDMMLCIVYLSCLLTPIEIFILQYIAFDSPLFIFLAICDGLCLVDLAVATHIHIFSPFLAELKLERTRLEKLQAKEGGGLAALGGIGALLQHHRGPSTSPSSPHEAHTIHPLRFFLHWLWTTPVPEMSKLFARFVGTLPLLSIPIAAALGLDGASVCLLLLGFLSFSPSFLLFFFLSFLLLFSFYASFLVFLFFLLFSFSLFLTLLPSRSSPPLQPCPPPPLKPRPHHQHPPSPIPQASN